MLRSLRLCEDVASRSAFSWGDAPRHCGRAKRPMEIFGPSVNLRAGTGRSKMRGVKKELATKREGRGKEVRRFVLDATCTIVSALCTTEVCNLDSGRPFVRRECSRCSKYRLQIIYNRQQDLKY